MTWQKSAEQPVRSASLAADPTQNLVTTIAGNGFTGFAGDGGPAAFAKLYYPSDIAVDSSGNVFIADDNNSRIRKVSVQGVITTVAGSTFGFGGDGGPATLAQLKAPNGIAVDSAGNLFIADTGNQRIRKISTDGTITTVAGTVGGFSGDGGPGTAAQLSGPVGVVVDAAGNLFIGDYGNNRVRKLAVDGTITTVAGNGTAGFSGDNGTATLAQLWGPGALALDSSGNLLIADSNNRRVRRVAGGVITTIAGTGTEFGLNGTIGDGGPATNASFKSPIRVAADANGNIFIADAGHSRIRRINLSGGIETVVGVGSPGFNGDGLPGPSTQVDTLRGMALDASGSLYFADSQNNRVRKLRTVPAGTPTIVSISPSTGVRGSTVAARITGTNLTGATSVTFSGTGVTASIGTIDSSSSMTINITIAIDAAVTTRTFRVTTPSGQSDFFAGFGVGLPLDDRAITTIAGNGVAGGGGDNGPSISAQVNQPAAVAIDSSGNVFIADSFNNRVRKINTSGVITTVAGTGTAGFSGDEDPVGHATGAKLNRPVDVAVDAAGNLFIADSLNFRVRKVTTDGVIHTVAGNGNPTFSGDGGLATAAAMAPTGIALDSFGNLYIADSDNSRVRLVNAQGVVSTVAGSGTQGFTGDGSSATLARLSGPWRLAIHPSGDLLIVDSGNKRVRRVNSMGMIDTIAGNGTGGNSSNEGDPAVSVSMSPSSVATDAAGNIYIADGGRVRRVDSTGAIVTVAGGGTGFGEGVPATYVFLSQPIGVASDPSGNLYLADGNHRVRSVGPVGAAAGSPIITGISAPGSGMQGTTVTATLTGFNFSGVNAVVFSGNGVTATISPGGSNTSIPVVISIDPAAASTFRTITVTTGTRVSNAFSGFTVNAIAAPSTPVIGSNIEGKPMLSVLSAAQGTTTPMMVVGTNFKGASAVTFSGSGVTTTILSGGTDTSIPVLLTIDPGAAVGNRTITITTAVGTSSPRSGFAVVPFVAGDVITTAAGGPCCIIPGNQPGVAILTTVNTPAGVAVDRAGNIFFAEPSTQRVRRVNPFGIFETAAGYINIPSFGGDGGPANQAGLNTPSDVAVDSSGSVYIADYGNNRIRKISVSGTISTIAGNGVADFTGDGGPATSAAVDSPRSVAVDAAGNVFIAEAARIRKVDTGGIIHTIAGDGSIGSAGDNGPATSATVSFPSGMAVDNTGNLLFVDAYRIRKIDVAGVITTIAGNGTQGTSGDGGPAVSAQVSAGDIAIDQAGNIYLAAGSRLRRIAPDGIINTIAGNGSGGVSGDDGPPLAAGISAGGVAVDPSGNLWIASSDRIRKITRTPLAPAITTIGPSSGVQGTTVFATINGSNLSGAAAIVFSGNGVSATISPGGNESSIPVVITIDPAAPQGVRTVKVITRENVSSLFNGFTVGITNLPRITSLTPNAGAQGAEFPMTLTGANLAGATAVTFDGVGVSAEVLDNTLDSSLQLTITISTSASTGPRNAIVTTANGTSAPFSGFTVTPNTPTISSLSVLSGVQGTVVPATISGTNLSGVTSVVFTGAGIAAAVSGPPTPTSLPINILISPTAPLGARSLIVGTADKISAAFNGFSVLQSSVPNVTAVVPGSVFRNSAVSGTIIGSNLSGVTTVAFAGTGVTAVVAGGGSSSQLPVTITVTAGAALGARTVTVTSPGGTSAQYTGFTVQSGSSTRITAVLPKGLTQGAPFSGTIFGQNLSGVTSVAFSGGGITATASNATSGSVQITGTVLSNAATGYRTVTVTTANGTSDAFNSVRVSSAPRPSVITTIAGTGEQGYSGDGYNAAWLAQPDATAIDGAGNLYIADSGNHRIRKITPNHVISTIAGNGTPGFSGDGGPAANALINNPNRLAIDTVGNILVADTGNHRIRRINPAGIIETIAGDGNATFGGDGAQAVNASLKAPAGVALDSSGNIWIADTGNHRVRKITSDGVIQTIAGTGTGAFSGDNGPPATAQIKSPASVFVDTAGRILIADTGNNRVRKIVGNTITTLAGSGTAAFSGDGGAATSAALSAPTDVKVDATGNVVIADNINQRIRQVDLAGVISTIAGNSDIGGFNANGLTGIFTMLNFPYGITIDPSGNILIADRNNARIRKLNTLGIVSTIAGDNHAGFNGDGPAAIFAQVTAWDTSVDPAGNLFIAAGMVRKVNSVSMITAVAGGGGVLDPLGDGGPAVGANLAARSVIADAAGNLYVADESNHRIRKVSASGVITTLAGTGVSGYSGDGGPASIAKVSGPRGMALDASGNLIFADSNNQRVRMITPGGTIVTLAGNGTAGFSGDSGPATAAKLNLPVGVAVDGSNNIFIADAGNNRVRKLTPGGNIDTVAGNGIADSGVDDDPAVSTSIAQPTDVAVDSDGNLYIAEGSVRVRMVSALGIMTTVAGNGSYGFSGDGGQSTSAQIVVDGIGIDGAGNLLISGDYRVRRVVFTTPPTIPAVTGIAPFFGTQGTVVPAVINGTALNGATSVTFSGSGVTASINGGGTANSLPVTITINAGAPPGLRTFSVHTGGGDSEDFSGFAVISSQVLPEITSINPIKGSIGSATPMVISGTGLTGATAVTFSGSGVSAVIGSGGTATSLPLTVNISQGASLDLRLVTVTTPIGPSSAFNGFTVFRPAITGISPSLGTVGFTAYGVLTGTNLSGATAVMFSGTGVSASILAGATDTSIPLQISVASSAATGVRDITVVTPNTSSLPFTGFTVGLLGPSGMITTFAGDGTTTFKGDGGPAFAASLFHPERVLLDSTGKVFISDRDHHRIRKVTADGVIATTIGTANGIFTPDGLPASATVVGEVVGTAIDSPGNFYFMDRSYNIVRKISTSDVVSTVAGTGNSGFGGDGGPATQALIDYPAHIALDAAGNLYIADFSNHRVRKVATNGTITTIAGTGVSGFSGDNGPATSAQLRTPFALALDLAGNLYIADSSDHRIRKVTPGGTITTVVGSGSSGFFGDNGSPLLAQLNSPQGIAVDGAGNLWIADTGNRRLRKVSGGIITTIAGNGNNGFSGDGGPAISAAVHPVDVAVDSEGNLYIADFDNHRVRKVLFAAPVRKARSQVISQ